MIEPNSKDRDRLTIRVDHDRKQSATKIAESLGTDLPHLVNMFLAQLVEENGMPFKPTNDLPRVDIEAALNDVKNGHVTDYSKDEFFQHLEEVASEAND